MFLSFQIERIGMSKYSKCADIFWGTPCVSFISSMTASAVTQSEAWGAGGRREPELKTGKRCPLRKHRPSSQQVHEQIQNPVPEGRAQAGPPPAPKAAPRAFRVASAEG